MGGSTGNLGGIVLSFMLATFMGLLATIIIGVLGNMGWWAAGGLGVGLTAALCLFFGVVLGGPSRRFDSAPSGSFAAKAAPVGAAAVMQAAVAPDLSEPVMSAPVISAPVMSAPVMSAPVMSAPVMSAPDDAAVAAAGMGIKPAGLSGPRGGNGDDLKTIEGIGPVLEKLCHEMGIFHFDQIAGWGAAEVAWMNASLKGFKGRVGRDKWVTQARRIGQVGMAEFKRRAEINDY